MSKLIEGNNKEKHPYQITGKGKKYKSNPLAEIEADKTMPPPPSTKTRSKTMTETSPPQASGQGEFDAGIRLQ